MSLPEPQISSRQNRWVKWVRSLGSKEERKRQGLTVLEGRRLIAEAVAAGVRLPLLFYQPEASQDPEAAALLARAQQAGSRVWLVSAEALAACSQTVTPPGILAVASWREQDLPPASRWDPPEGVMLCLAGIQDPGNVGTILRAALAAAARGVIVGPGTAEVSSPKTMRASMGAVFRVPTWRASSWEFLRELRQKGWRLLAADVREGNPPFQVPLSSGVIIALGGEAWGLPADLAGQADGRVAIPMPGGSESLNVAMAASILLYESVRQRLADASGGRARATCGPGRPVI